MTLMANCRSFVHCFSAVEDPRVERSRLHPLINILVISVCAVICGAEGWDDIVEFARAKHDWFAERLDLTNGIPCADTFRRVFERLDPQCFATCFLEWTRSL